MLHLHPRYILFAFLNLNCNGSREDSRLRGPLCETSSHASGEVGKSGELRGNLWIVVKIYTQRDSWEVNGELLGDFAARSWEVSLPPNHTQNRSPNVVPRWVGGAFNLLEDGRLFTSGRTKAHKHKLFGPVALGMSSALSQAQLGFVSGTNPLCPRDKPSFSPYSAQWKPSLSLGTNRACPWDIPGDKGRQKKF